LDLATGAAGPEISPVAGPAIQPMSSPSAPQEVSPRRPARSAGRWAVIGVFLLLAAGFLFRLIQNAYFWLSGRTLAEMNYKVLTVWCLVYVVVCSGVAAAAYWLPGEDDDNPAEKPPFRERAAGLRRAGPDPAFWACASASLAADWSA
jgi:hypothetical protein